MQIIDNINKTVKDDLQAGIHKGSKMSVAAACFSIYAYQELKKQLDGIDELRFIFTSPTFVTEKASKAQREFYIPRISRECSLYGTEFEVKLRNELTQKAIAKECADWIRRKVVFKSNVTQEQMMGFMTVDESTYMPINGFTTVDLGCERGNNAYYPVQKTESFENANYFLRLFEQLWNDKKKLQEVTDVVIENISAAYRENAPEYIYFVALYNIFNDFKGLPLVAAKPFKPFYVSPDDLPIVDFDDFECTVKNSREIFTAPHLIIKQSHKNGIFLSEVLDYDAVFKYF